jgi:hypothetical protein
MADALKRVIGWMAWANRDLNGGSIGHFTSAHGIALMIASIRVRI